MVCMDEMMSLLACFKKCGFEDDRKCAGEKKKLDECMIFHVSNTPHCGSSSLWHKHDWNAGSTVFSLALSPNPLPFLNLCRKHMLATVYSAAAKPYYRTSFPLSLSSPGKTTEGSQYDQLPLAASK